MMRLRWCFCSTLLIKKSIPNTTAIISPATTTVAVVPPFLRVLLGISQITSPATTRMPKAINHFKTNSVSTMRMAMTMPTAGMMPGIPSR